MLGDQYSMARPSLPWHDWHCTMTFRPAVLSPAACANGEVTTRAAKPRIKPRMLCSVNPPSELARTWPCRTCRASFLIFQVFPSVDEHCDIHRITGLLRL